MKIGILTDSTCDLSKEILDKFNIEVLPLSVHFGERVFEDGVDIDADTFFAMLPQNDELPHTSQPPLGLFLEKYRELLKKYDHIVSVHLSGGLSGTCESARMAAEQLDSEKVTVIDSSTISLGLGMMVVLVARMVENNKGLDYIVKTVERIKKNLYLFFTVNDLTYMEKGGRIGKASSFLGSIFKINPIISISTKTGKVEPITKVRGKKRAMEKLIDIVQDKIRDAENIWLGFAHGDRKEDMEKIKNFLVEKIKERPDVNLQIFKSRISPTLGCHVGPSVYAVFTLTGFNFKN